MTKLDSTQAQCADAEPYALQVLGDSMEPEFPNGCVIVSEPNAVIENGCYVIAKHQGEYIFRQLWIDDDQQKWTLKALKTNEPEIELSGPEEVHARVVQSTNGRRHTRKSYV